MCIRDRPTPPTPRPRLPARAPTRSSSPSCPARAAAPTWKERSDDRPSPQPAQPPPLTQPEDPHPMNTAEKSVGLGLRALRQLSSSEFLDRLGVRSHPERALYSSTKNGFKSATAAGRAYKAATSLGKPARQPRAAGKGLFDLTPADEQQMLVE